MLTTSRFTGSLIGLAGLLSACGGAGETCTAVGYSHTAVVNLASEWPPANDRTVTLSCAEDCGVMDTDLVEQLSANSAGEATFELPTAPRSVVIRVADSSGLEREIRADLVWRRVGGTAECGGPSESIVNVPFS